MRHRPSSRLVVLNPEGSVLLFHFVFNEGALAGQVFWATPGGALSAGESYRDAARRELVEETGIVAEIGKEIAQRRTVFRTPSGEQVSADERYFLVRVAGNTINAEGQEPLEAEFMKEHRWWPVTELQGTQETVYPEDIVQIVRQQLEDHRNRS